jgi:N,N'-diacetyllegionaminate synthase
MNIDKKKIGLNQPSLIIAEVGQAHDGSLGMAHSYIDAIADAGADAVKFQTHIASAESTKDENFRVNFSFQDKTRYEYWKRMEFTKDQWRGLAEHAKSKGLIFLSSPFSHEALDLLIELDVKAWKVGSGEFNSANLLEKMIKTKLPILYSTGMSYWKEIDKQVEIFNNNGAEFVLMQCTSMYPTPIEFTGINIIDEFRQRYNCLTGLSDHSGDIYTSIFASSIKVDVIEVHVTFDRKMFGPDTSSSLEFKELSILTEANRKFHNLRNLSVDKDNVANQLSQTRKLFTKSLAPSKDLKPGDILTYADLMLKKPGTGLSEFDAKTIVGRKIKKHVPFNQLLSWDDVE